MPDNQYITEAKRIKEIRLKLRKKPEEIALLMNISVNAYYSIELGRSGLSMAFLSTIANLGGNLNYIFTGNGPLTLGVNNKGDVINKQISDAEILELIQNLQVQIDDLKKIKAKK